MKLLILTQKVDRLDTGVLGFFHSWVKEFSEYFEKITVICLEKGEYDLGQNVNVLSLGKERGRSKFKYIFNFYSYIWMERKNYDAVFVHMNQEYVLMAGLLWKFLGKRVFMWRNHRKGSFLTNIAVLLSDRVFFTSPDSYTSRFKKSLMMPTGINIDKFLNSPTVRRSPNTILSMGRIGPVKNTDVCVRALNLLYRVRQNFRATVVGSPDEGEEKYYENILRDGKKLTEAGVLTFKDFISNDRTPEMYGSHEIFVNLTASGSMDKTIFSAMVSGALVLVSNTYFKGIIPNEFIFEHNSPSDLAIKLEVILSMPVEKKKEISKRMKEYVLDNHSLKATVAKLANTMGV